MINLNKAELRDKIYACWLGKNIGGTLGTPFEGRRKLLDVTGFNSEPGNPLPNDDLDLQLVWLKALEENGPDKLNERVLGEYWQEYISPYWNEYGIGKSNMVRGLVPPLSGEYENNWKHSNGAWIRTEVWACLNPGLVEETIRFGYMDACVDHGMGEGTYATIFVAAMEAAAFVEKDLRKLIEIGLSKIPESCRFYKFITAAVEAFDSGKTWQKAREIVTDMALSDPAIAGPTGGWFQAPANVSYAVIGLLYGGGDFKKTLLTAVNCGDDTDCTGATVGALLGIIGGTAVIPEDWKAYIGDGIVTVAINRGACYGIPLSCTALTDRIVSLHAVTLRGKQNVRVSDEPTSADKADVEKFKGKAFSDSLGARSAYGFDMDFILSHVRVDYDRAPDIEPNGSIGVKLTVTNKFRSQKHFQVRFLLPDGWTVTGKKNLSVMTMGNSASETYTLTAGEDVSSKNRGVIEITCEGHSDVALVPLVFLG